MFYTDLPIYLNQVQIPVYGAYLNGKDINSVGFSSSGFILIGNESKGIDSVLERFVTHKVTIPKVGRAESLNAAIAAGIFCYAVSIR